MLRRNVSHVRRGALRGENMGQNKTNLELNEFSVVFLVKVVWKFPLLYHFWRSS